MEPGAKLFQPIGGRPYTPTAAQDREFVNSLCTVVPFPKDFIERVPNKWQKTIHEFSPKLAPNGEPATLEFIRNIFEIQEEDWAFISDVLQPDPKMRPSADQLLQHPWLNY
jgi:serine/threonine protein kinase